MMDDVKKGSEVVLVREGRAITRFQLDLPAGMLVEQINSGKRRFRCFGRGEELTTVQDGERVFVYTGDMNPDSEGRKPGLKGVAEGSTVQQPSGLTGRQRQVLDGLVRGQTLAEIGFRLGIRTRSVRHHVDALKSKLMAVSLSQLVAQALAAGLLKSTPPQGGTRAGRRSDHPKKY
jgi:DNA-binding CsgD family transcriptional regulator